jgi:hypothetical protein
LAEASWLSKLRLSGEPFFQSLAMDTPLISSYPAAYISSPEAKTELTEMTPFFQKRPLTKMPSKNDTIVRIIVYLID